MKSDIDDTKGPANVDTPWEFYPDDDLREDPPQAAETAAMHVERVEVAPATEIEPDDAPDVVVHYLHDEEPEVPDPTEPRPDANSTSTVDDLLEEQHYLPPEDDSD